MLGADGAMLGLQALVPAPQIVSGLVNFVPIEKMLHRRVVVLANLKPAKMRDIISSGMVRPSCRSLTWLSGCLHALQETSRSKCS